tara:strand:- start:86 stop:241 length:156 start_codon:yes stop_codon:yes gene_type:complete
MEPEGMYLGSAINVLHDEINKATIIRGVHSFMISLTDVFMEKLIKYLVIYI